MQKLIPTLSLPTVGEQASTLVRELGDILRQRNPAERIRIELAKWAAIIGAVNAEGVWYVIQELLDSGILHGKVEKNFNDTGLTFKGWARYEELRRAHSEGAIAFIAMQFNDPTMDRVYKECFQPACAQAGFDLRTIAHNAPAGLIDDRLRVEIRKARFAVADLTHGNQGAYWEAGYAEGLGKPVIYTCEKTVFQTKKTHFDTNHCHTVILGRRRSETCEQN